MEPVKTPQEELISINRSHAQRMADEFLELHRLSNIIRMTDDPQLQEHHLKDIESRLQKVDFDYITPMFKNFTSIKL